MQPLLRCYSSDVSLCKNEVCQLRCNANWSNEPTVLTNQSQKKWDLHTNSLNSWNEIQDAQ